MTGTHVFLAFETHVRGELWIGKGGDGEQGKKHDRKIKVSVGRPALAGAQGHRLGHYSGLRSRPTTLLPTPATSSVTHSVLPEPPSSSNLLLSTKQPFTDRSGQGDSRKEYFVSLVPPPLYPAIPISQFPPYPPRTASGIITDEKVLRATGSGQLQRNVICWT